MPTAVIRAKAQANWGTARRGRVWAMDLGLNRNDDRAYAALGMQERNGRANQLSAALVSEALGAHHAAVAALTADRANRDARPPVALPLDVSPYAPNSPNLSPVSAYTAVGRYIAA